MNNTDRHLRRLKKQCTIASLASLAWLESEGLKPIKVEVLNSKTKELETITLTSIGEALQLEEETLDKEDLDIVRLV